MNLSLDQLILDLYSAERIARKGKTSKQYVQFFEQNLDENIRNLANELYTHTYKQQPFKRFIFNGHNKIKREVFAAKYRDRIVHHLYFNYTHKIFEKTFITDCYSCIKNRGTSYGIKRLEHHIHSESLNYTRPCYVLQLDLTAYFMNINRDILFKLVNKCLQKYKDQYESILDFDFIFYLTDTIINIDPIKHCNYLPLSAYEGLPLYKTLVGALAGHGLPIGNLTSQLFSNVYMNIFDQFVKRDLKCKHYGRYVDDSFIVSTDFNFLVSLIPKIDNFLANNLDQTLNKKKTKITNAYYGVKFLGSYIKPFRRYVTNTTLKHIKNNYTKNNKFPYKSYLSKQSKVGYLKQYKSFNIKKQLHNL